jgi:hypothetical protein
MMRKKRTENEKERKGRKIYAKLKGINRKQGRKKGSIDIHCKMRNRNVRNY